MSDEQRATDEEIREFKRIMSLRPPEGSILKFQDGTVRIPIELMDQVDAIVSAGPRILNRLADAERAERELDYANAEVKSLGRGYTEMKSENAALQRRGEMKDKCEADTVVLLIAWISIPVILWGRLIYLVLQ